MKPVLGKYQRTDKKIFGRRIIGSIFEKILIDNLFMEQNNNNTL
jgi:hypothetical protein